MAANIVFVSDMLHERSRDRALLRRMDDIFDAWTSLEHRDFYEFRKREMEREAEDDGWGDVPMEELGAGSMGEMIAKMRRISDRASDVADSGGR